MSTVLGILGLYGLFTLLTILAQATAAFLQVGDPMLRSPRDNMPKLTGVAGRLDRAQLNAIVAMALFAPAVLILAQNGITSSSSLIAAQIFLVARVIYVPLYAAGVPTLRTIVWLAGFLATGWLYICGL